jgi:hypothetical protein
VTAFLRALLALLLLVPAAAAASPGQEGSPRKRILPLCPEKQDLRLSG